MKSSMTGQEEGDCLLEVTTWTGTTVYVYCQKLPNVFV